MAPPTRSATEAHSGCGAADALKKTKLQRRVVGEVLGGGSWTDPLPHSTKLCVCHVNEPNGSP